jgi:hypothetical protein
MTNNKKVALIKLQTMKRRELTREERAEAERLAAAWLMYKGANKGVTQEWLGAETGLGTQGAVGQYLRGVIPLNVEALMAFARVLSVDPRSISARLASIVDGLERKVEANASGFLAGASTEADALVRLLTVYHLADADGKGAIDDVVDLIEAHLAASRQDRRRAG